MKNVYSTKNNKKMDKKPSFMKKASQIGLIVTALAATDAASANVFTSAHGSIDNNQVEQSAIVDEFGQTILPDTTFNSSTQQVGANASIFTSRLDLNAGYMQTMGQDPNGNASALLKFPTSNPTSQGDNKTPLRGGMFSIGAGAGFTPGGLSLTGVTALQNRIGNIILNGQYASSNTTDEDNTVQKNKSLELGGTLEGIARTENTELTAGLNVSRFEERSETTPENRESSDRTVLRNNVNPYIALANPESAMKFLIGTYGFTWGNYTNHRGALRSTWSLPGESNRLRANINGSWNPDRNSGYLRPGFSISTSNLEENLLNEVERSEAMGDANNPVNSSKAAKATLEQRGRTGASFGTYFQFGTNENKLSFTIDGTKKWPSSFKLGGGLEYGKSWLGQDASGNNLTGFEVSPTLKIGLKNLQIEAKYTHQRRDLPQEELNTEKGNMTNNTWAGYVNCDF